MKRQRVNFDPSKVLLVEQALKLTPSQRFQYALGLAKFALEVNPRLMENRAHILNYEGGSVQKRRKAAGRHG